MSSILQKQSAIKRTVSGCSLHSVRLKLRKYACGTYTVCEQCTHTHAKLRTHLWGELGSLRLSFTSEGVNNPGEFSVGMIKGARVIFMPGVELRDAISGMKFEKGETK